MERSLRAILGNQALLRLQDPVQLNHYSEPEPDIAVVRVHPLDYEDHHPTPDETYLLVEVADTTLRRDRELKALLCAQAGVADYWILDLTGQ